MIGCLRTRVRKQPIIVLYFEFENELKFYNLEASARSFFFRRSARLAFGLVQSVWFDSELCEVQFNSLLGSLGSSKARFSVELGFCFCLFVFLFG